MSKVVVHDKDGNIESEFEVSNVRDIVLKEDLVIPKGTVLMHVPKGKRYNFYEHSIGLHPDSCAGIVIPKDMLKVRPDLFEEVEE